MTPKHELWNAAISLELRSVVPEYNVGSMILQKAEFEFNGTVSQKVQGDPWTKPKLWSAISLIVLSKS